MFNGNCRTIHKRIDFFLRIDRKQPQRSSEILPSLLDCHPEFFLDTLRRGRPFGHEGKLEVADDPIDNFIPLWLIELKAVHVPSKM